MVLVVEVMLVEVDKVLDGGAKLVRDGGRMERVNGIKVHHGVENVFDVARVLLRAERHERVVEGGCHGPGSLDGRAKEVAEGIVWDGRGVAG